MSPRQVLIAPDKFRGTAAAAEVAATIADVARLKGWAATEVPLSDGGEGLLEVVGGANRVSVVAGPLGDAVSARWIMRDGLAVIEAAEACGLLLAGGADRNDPVRASSTGVGELVLEALDAGAAEILVGLGGSACTDGGAGALAALGASAHEWSGFGRATVTVCCDVETRYVEAARDFGPQKGATPEQVDFLEKRLFRLRHDLRERFDVDPQAVPGSGAAGGLAGALAAIGARLAPGFQHVAERVGLARHIAASDLVITGEGRLDSSSLQGKVVGGVLGQAGAARVPAVVIVGAAAHGIDVGSPIHSLSEQFGTEAALQHTLDCVRKIAVEVLTSAQPIA